MYAGRLNCLLSALLQFEAKSKESYSLAVAVADLAISIETFDEKHLCGYVFYSLQPALPDDCH